MTTYKPSFPCKIISSFFDNYYKEHYYDIIKLITYRRLIIKSDLEKVIYTLFEMFQFFYSMPLYESIDFYNKNMKKHNFISVNIDIKIDDIYMTIIELNDLINKEDDIKNKFYYYLMITKLLNIEFEKSIVPPLNLEDKLANITNDSVKCYFIKSWLFNLYNGSKYKPIKEELIKLYTKNKYNLQMLGVENIFIFGSVNQGTDNIYSDIDIIIKLLNDVNKESVLNYIHSFNKNHFNKDTDILDYELGKTLHNINKCTKIF